MAEQVKERIYTEKESRNGSKSYRIGAMKKMNSQEVRKYKISN
jgi:hypothetical protein